MEDGRILQQEGGQNSRQHKEEHIPDKAPAGRAVQLVPLLALERRVGVEAVSYTHLDVYKRQPVLSLRAAPDRPVRANLYGKEKIYHGSVHW